MALQAAIENVATVLTACGIETVVMVTLVKPKPSVATVLTACGIETCRNNVH